MLEPAASAGRSSDGCGARKKESLRGSLGVHWLCSTACETHGGTALGSARVSFAAEVRSSTAAPSVTSSGTWLGLGLGSGFGLGLGSGVGLGVGVELG